MRAGVLGHPIAHSLSPTLHRAAYAALGLDWQYDAYDVTEQQLPGFIGDCARGWAGLSLTMPLKQAVLPLLDDISPLAQQVQAVNTVLFRDGRVVGDNTDVDGMVAAVRGLGLAACGSAAVLGGGSTSRSALAALAHLGAGQVSVYVRRPEAGEQMRPLAEGLRLDLLVEPWERAAESLLADVVVSTVPAGIADSLAEAVPWQPGALLDVVYAGWPTPLARTWSERGGPVASGLDMLLEQAALQVELMTGSPAPREAMLAALPGNGPTGGA